MVTLYLLRHCNAAGGGPGGDHTRPLNAKGRAAAAALGEYLAANAKTPGAVLCSSAERARETWALVAAQLQDPPDAVMQREIYDADGNDIVLALRETGADIASLMVLGHNPTLHQLAFALSRQDEGEALDRLARDFPPGALAEIEFGDGGWAEIAPGSGRLVSLVTPADLV